MHREPIAANIWDFVFMKGVHLVHNLRDWHPFHYNESKNCKFFQPQIDADVKR